MKAHILSLLFILSCANVVFSENLNNFGFDYLFDMLFGDDSSEEIASVPNHAISNLTHAVTNLSSTIQNKVPGVNSASNVDVAAQDKLDQIPHIISYLMNLTTAVENVHIQLHKNQEFSHVGPSTSTNEINVAANAEISKPDLASTTENEKKDENEGASAAEGTAPSDGDTPNISD